MLAQRAESVAAAVGTLDQIGELARSSFNDRLNWANVPALAQVQSDVGLNMATQMAAYTETIRNLPTVTGQLGNAVSQISASAREAFGAFPIPGVADLLANQ